MVIGLPMLHGTNNGDSKTSNGKPSNASINSTPSVDRYAALKDLDEQFREIKLEQQAEANNNTITSNGTATTISDSITPSMCLRRDCCVRDETNSFSNLFSFLGQPVQNGQSVPTATAATACTTANDGLAYQWCHQRYDAGCTASGNERRDWILCYITLSGRIRSLCQPTALQRQCCEWW